MTPRDLRTAARITRSLVISNDPLQQAGHHRYPHSDTKSQIGRERRDVGFIYGGQNAITERVNHQIGLIRSINTCSIFGVHCQLTLSRVGTRQLCEDICDEGPGTAGSVGAVVTIGCTKAGGPLAGGICGVVWGAAQAQFFSDLNRATDQGDCFAMRNFFIAGDPRAAFNPTVIDDGERCDQASEAGGQ